MNEAHDLKTPTTEGRSWRAIKVKITIKMAATPRISNIRNSMVDIELFVVCCGEFNIDYSD